MSRVVLVVNDAAAPSETFLRSVAEGLRGRGHDVVVLEGGRQWRRPPMAGVAQALPSVRSPRFLASLVRWVARDAARAVRLLLAARGAEGVAGTARAFARALPIVQSRPDVVIFAFSGIAVAHLDVLPLLGVPTVVSCRGSAEIVRPRLDPSRAEELRRLFEQVTVVHCVSEAMAELVRTWGATDIVVVRPAVDTDAFVPAPARSAPPPLRLVSVGRLEWTKGYDDAIRAVAQLRGDGVEVTYRLLGGGPEQDRLRWLVDELGLTDVVTLAGTAGADEVRTALAEAHVFVHPSLSEGISNAVLEAMAMQLAVVCTRVGGMAEVITDGADGLLVDPLRPDELTRALRRLAGESGAVDRLGAAARATVAGRFARADQVDAYDELVSAARRRWSGR